MKRKMGAFDATSLIIPAGVLIGGYVVLNKLGLFGSSANTGNNASVDSNSNSTVAAALAQAKVQGITQTINDVELNSIATFLFETGTGTKSSDAMDSMVVAIVQVRNLADLLRLIQLFGTKQVGNNTWLNPCYYIGLFCQSVDLGAFLNMALDPAHLAQLNQYFASQSINFQF